MLAIVLRARDTVPALAGGNMLTLTRFRVTSFRSVHDSGWIEADAVTALIGTNESGKTNLLIPLWKLNPAKEGEIDRIADFPRAEYNRMRGVAEDRIFIRAEFRSDAQLQERLASVTKCDAAYFDIVQVARRFDGKHEVTFPNASSPRSIPKFEVEDALSATASALAAEKTQGIEDALRVQMGAAIAEARKRLASFDANRVDSEAIAAAQEPLSIVSLGEPAENSTLVPRWRGLITALETFVAGMNLPHPAEVAEAIDAVLKSMPVFVYYSNYGNLDSEIYLPHVIENMKRRNLGPKEAGKARTLKVLFEYVRLSPEEILKLGAPATVAAAGAAPTPAAIDEALKRTKERDILLRSADTELTKAFREWWKQGDYRFRFAADGDYFRIWVSDDRRPEDIELESRSTGLQWFFSFFLVFLVERRDAHKGAILLLDEPGLSLHPLSQRDLSAFFENLAQTNPLIYTTHSPFLVDADHLDRVRLVYVDQAGATAVSSDLRAQSRATAEGRSVYAVHAALGLSVSDAMLQGCTSVVVEGPSDQFYLTAMKTVLIAKGKYAPKRELLFVPAGGAKGVNAIVPIVAAKDEALPIVLLDDDRQGRQFADALRGGPLYKSAPHRVINVKEFAKFEFSEIEDLIPMETLADVVSRIARGPADDFRDVAKPGSAIVPQIEAYAAANKLTLADPGWKVDLARHAKQRLLKEMDKIDEATLNTWASLFARFEL